MNRKIRRNESCSCGSGRKYRRCCGKSFENQNYDIKTVSSTELKEVISGMDPELIKKISKSFQGVPSHQLSKFQGFVQQAMQGKDIVEDFMQFKTTLPADVQNLLDTMENQLQSLTGGQQNPEPDLTEAEARELVLQAMAEGRISQEEVGEVLQNTSEDKKESGSPSGISKILRGLGYKKS
jgi:hypothetical protein